MHDFIAAHGLLLSAICMSLMWVIAFSVWAYDYRHQDLTSRYSDDEHDHNEDIAA